MTSCIGCCVYVCKKRENNKNIDQVETTDGMNIYELEKIESEHKQPPKELKIEDLWVRFNIPQKSQFIIGFHSSVDNNYQNMTR